MTKINGNGVSWKWLGGIVAVAILSMGGWIATSTTAAICRNEMRILGNCERVAGIEGAIKGMATSITEIKTDIRGIRNKLAAP